MPIVEMLVSIDCSGCESKVRKALLKLEGVQDVDIDMAKQKVTVTGWMSREKALKTVRKTNKKAVYWPWPFNPEYHTYTQEYYQQHQSTPAHRFIFNAKAASSYNYRKHGYDDPNLHGYYHGPAYNHIVDDKARAIFSDDNPNACSIM
ncbi:heavy metal-associated isoprenylated plant protein 28-like [Typha angustifolia]|uniref:heavy metal-associated isoprenylated plant protein 28-like n=1 Tax=Typha angustifolia TaxID=59011 RepID=UPI003C2CD02F